MLVGFADVTDPGFKAYGYKIPEAPPKNSCHRTPPMAVDAGPGDASRYYSRRALRTETGIRGAAKVDEC